MTNSWNTPVEVFEQAYPARIRTYAIRRGSGGKGRYRGGDGIVREIELLAPAQVGLLCDRRKRGPYGLAGGTPGKPGKNILLRQNTKHAGKHPLPGKCAFFADAGMILRIETPGGGGWGKLRPAKKKRASKTPALKKSKP